MDMLYGVGDRFVVVDVETTGVYNSDRVVEVAVVTVSPRGRIVDEWDTLVNPERDVGPTHLHRVTASMVSAAPTFRDIAAALAERLNGAVLVAHNLSFDARMLVNEYGRLGGSMEAGSGVCTLRRFGRKLQDACKHQGIPFEYPHRALADARATARLFRCEPIEESADLRPAAVVVGEATFNPRTLRREMSAEPTDEMPYLARLADRTHHYGVHGAGLVYLDLLDWVLSDLVISDAEAAQLKELAIDVGLSEAEVSMLHVQYLDELIEAAMRDGVVQQHEMAILERVSRALAVPTERVAARVGGMVRRAPVSITPGMRVCFTGAATDSDGSPIERARLIQVAVEAGLHPVDHLTKKGCDVLVAADPASQSGKARKAREYGIPICSVESFLELSRDAQSMSV